MYQSINNSMFPRVKLDLFVEITLLSLLNLIDLYNPSIDSYGLSIKTFCSITFNFYNCLTCSLLLLLHLLLLFLDFLFLLLLLKMFLIIQWFCKVYLYISLDHTNSIHILYNRLHF